MSSAAPDPLRPPLRCAPSCRAGWDGSRLERVSSTLPARPPPASRWSSDREWKHSASASRPPWGWERSRRATPRSGSPWSCPARPPPDCHAGPDRRAAPTSWWRPAARWGHARRGVAPAPARSWRQTGSCRADWHIGPVSRAWWGLSRGVAGSPPAERRCPRPDSPATWGRPWCPWSRCGRRRRCPPRCDRGCGWSSAPSRRCATDGCPGRGWRNPWSGCGSWTCGPSARRRCAPPRAPRSWRTAPWASPPRPARRRAPCRRRGGYWRSGCWRTWGCAAWNGSSAPAWWAADWGNPRSAAPGSAAWPRARSRWTGHHPPPRWSGPARRQSASPARTGWCLCPGIRRPAGSGSCSASARAPPGCSWAAGSASRWGRRNPGRCRPPSGGDNARRAGPSTPLPARGRCAWLWPAGWGRSSSWRSGWWGPRACPCRCRAPPRSAPWAAPTDRYRRTGKNWPWGSGSCARGELSRAPGYGRWRPSAPAPPCGQGSGRPAPSSLAPPCW